MKTEDKHIVLVTTTHLSANPRLLKETTALAGGHYRVTVVCCYTKQWAFEADREILKQAPFKAILVGGTPRQNRLLWHFGRFRRKICAWLPALPPCRRRMFAQGYDEMLTAALRMKADLYIAHNLGTLAVAAHAGQKLGVPYAFDAEDFHREESVSDTGSGMGKWKRLLEEQYFPGAAYLTAASPLIAEEYQKHFPAKSFTTLNNVFPRAQQPPFRESAGGPLKLFWFSQTIGTDRGLGDVFAALQRIPHIPVRLTLLGRCTEAIKQTFLSRRSTPDHVIQILDPVAPDSIFELAAGQDIGLALEPGFSKNNDIALSNKIFTYLLAGNAVIATETSAQKQFMEQYPGVGRSYRIGDVQALAAHLEHYYLNRQALHDARRAAWRLANEKLNWEEEQKKLLRLVESVWT